MLITMEFVQAQGCSPRLHPSGQAPLTVTSLNLLQTEIKFVFRDLSENACNREKKYVAGGVIHEHAEAPTSNRKGRHNPTQEIRVNWGMRKKIQEVSAFCFLLLIQEVFWAFLCWKFWIREDSSSGSQWSLRILLFIFTTTRFLPHMASSRDMWDYHHFYLSGK